MPRTHLAPGLRDSADAVVIGAGPAGLAVARQLDHRHGVKALVLDRAAAPAISWRTRYDDFRLNTTGFLSHLPGQRIPLSAGRWPTKEDMVRYFDRYVVRQQIRVLLGCEVHSIDRDGAVWQLDTSSGKITSRTIVLATGNYGAPTAPRWPGLESFQGEIVHSGEFVNAWPYRGRDVLVVGAGNSAADIAVQLANDGARRIWLAVRTPPHLVRRAVGGFPSDIFLELSARVPARMVDPLIARVTGLMWGDLSPYGFQRPTVGLKATVETRGRIPTLADGLVSVVRARRVEVVGAVTRLEPDSVVLADGTSVTPEVIITATGFETNLRGMVGHLGVVDEHGNPRGGFACHVGEGMFAIGYGIPPNGPLRAIRLAATPLAAKVAGYLRQSQNSEQLAAV
ncbi:NAD(P)/FAD-dependent oxidoreductase [Mycobacterium sp. E2479]|uniref:flavin-containing monooxygenase n=1 Tax=Mycobacterium sp. E2479 TaxID=1834134 RepID=UPI000801812C|nr:NAD(P)/FAD-dependent oxidoreductase [Mycobacterium sp. E2479]OBH64449.1 pyridine nucleotide-disulfide oxidoreductase [Mycobacterium sp. E2479]